MKGLSALGHRALVADAEEIGLRARELVEACDLVVDHTDTLRREALLRSHVRLLLEAEGARLVGAPAAACLLADDKAAAKERLARAGVPTPPGITVSSPAWEPPPWLGPPLVVKPSFGHMSRGVAVAADLPAARAAAAGLLASGVPALIERYVPGRELGVCVLEGAGGPRMLPPVEWRLAAGMLSAAYKLAEPPPDRGDLGPADLPPRLAAELESMALAAFDCLGLRDYARFDVRLTSAGTPYFLEANATPSLERQEALALSARLAGLDYPGLVAHLLASASARHGPPGPGRREASVALGEWHLALSVPRGVHAPPESTAELARLFDVAPGDEVLELGCGAGLLSVAAALRGARRVVAVDLDPGALDATAENARRCGVADRVEVRAGSWYEALDGEPGTFDVVVATPPQTPAPRSIGPRWGGPEGLRHLVPVIEGAAAVLRAGRGRLWLLNLSTARPAEVLRLLDERFERVEVAAETERPFTPAEFEALEPGLFPYLLALRDRGLAEFEPRGAGRFAFRNRFLRASEPRAR